MCLAVPGRIVSLLPTKAPFATALVEFDGVRREVNVACVPEARPGHYVMVHAGIAISRVDADQAARVLETLHELGLEENEPVDGATGMSKARPR